jgi:hypothetical protein
MFNPTADVRVTNDARPYVDQIDPTPAFASLGTLARRVTGVDVRTLQSGTVVLVDTCNSRYRLVMLDEGGRRALVDGGHHFDREVEARIEGSTLGGSLLRVGWIGLDLFLELTVEGKRIGTSRIRSIAVSDRHLEAGVRSETPDTRRLLEV